MLAKHRDRALTEEQRLRWVQLICAAADEAGLPADPSSARRSSPTSSGARGSRSRTPSRTPSRRPRRRCRAGAGARRRRTFRRIRRRWRSASSPARAPTRCRGSRAAAPEPVRDAVGRGARRRAGRSPAWRSRTSRGTARVTCGSPTTSTHRANIGALAQLGVDAAIAVTVCGAVDPGVELGSLICFDDLHFPVNRLPDGSLCTFYAEPGDPRRGHWIYEDPYAPALRAALLGGRGGAAGCRCATAAATATSTGRASTRRPRSAGSRRPA